MVSMLELLYSLHFSSQVTKTTLISTTLSWQDLLPDEDRLTYLFSQVAPSANHWLESLQPRLLDGLAQINTTGDFPLLLVRCEERLSSLALLAEVAQQTLPVTDQIFWDYQTNSDGDYQLRQTERAQSQTQVHYAEWIEADQLFGYCRPGKQGWVPELGLIHQANGGTLVLSVRTLLAQPLLWLRLKKFVSERLFTWMAQDERQPVPLALPAMPLAINLIICGDRDGLADFAEIEPELAETAIYTEIEGMLQLRQDAQLADWRQLIMQLASRANMPPPELSFLLRLYREAIRYSGDQQRLPISTSWLLNHLNSAYVQGGLTGECLQKALVRRDWRESYLSDTLHQELASSHSLIETSGQQIGQINGLSVLDFPGHPRPWGEPSRISCVVHYGDGEINDVERKAELAGNIHTKGMLIIEAWLMAELDLDQQLPFSASMVFEQSYAEVDGDSASLAELSALISALASQPIAQNIAVTGSVDQFGNVQPVGGLNEKIEGFFKLCLSRGLTGVQGVILPQRNLQHLALSDQVIDAVKRQEFHLWPVTRVDEALNLLLNKIWRSDDEESLLAIIHARIEHALLPAKNSGWRPWPLRWLNWSKD